MLPIVLTLAGLCAPLAGQSPTMKRRVALTFDDLPNGGAELSLEALRSMTTRLLGVLKAAHAPAVGFVNGGKLEVEGEREARVKVLEMWLEAGFELGNHTYSHPDYNSTPALTYQADVLKGDEALKPLLKAHGVESKWFRHPFTHTGEDQAARDNLDGFLKHRGYRVAPFTIEQADFLFAAVYRQALARKDTALAERVRKEYLDYTDVRVEWFEKVSRETLDYEVSQILLLHANELNADGLAEILARLKRRGYEFVTLEEAMKDQAYLRLDRYVGPRGPSWLYRWAAGPNMPNPRRNEPEPPAWVVEAFKGREK